MTTIDLVAIPNRGRAASLARLVAGIKDLGHGRLQVMVVDRSRDTAHSDPGTEGCTFIGRPAVAALIDALVDVGHERSVVEFAFADPLGLDLAPGATRNVIAAFAGEETHLSIDDDMDPRLVPTPGSSDEVGRDDGDPSEFWYWPSIEAARDDLRRSGRGDIVAELGAALARDLGGRRATAAWAGFVGDVATPNALAYVGVGGASRDRLMRAGYSAAMASRIVLRGVTRNLVTRGFGWTPATVAYRGGAAIPPFLPVLRGEGLVWGQLAAYCGVGPLLRTPYNVWHEPPTPRHFAARDLDDHTRSFATATCIGMLLQLVGPCDLRTPAERLSHLGRGLVALSNDGAGLRAAVVRADELRRQHQLAALDELVRRDSAGTLAWHEDVERASAALRAYPDACDVPFDLAAHEDASQRRALLQALVHDFGRLLVSWRELLTDARRIGARLMREHDTGGGRSGRTTRDAGDRQG